MPVPDAVLSDTDGASASFTPPRLGTVRIPGPVLDLARAIHRTPAELTWQETLAKHAELVATVEAIAEELPETPDGRLIPAAGSQRPPMLIDGNHRATALALHPLRTGEFVPIEVYTGLPGRVLLSSVLSRALLQACRFRHLRSLSPGGTRSPSRRGSTVPGVRGQSAERSPVARVVRPVPSSPLPRSAP